MKKFLAAMFALVLIASFPVIAYAVDSSVRGRSIEPTYPEYKEEYTNVDFSQAYDITTSGVWRRIYSPQSGSAYVRTTVHVMYYGDGRALAWIQGTGANDTYYIDDDETVTNYMLDTGEIHCNTTQANETYHQGEVWNGTTLVYWWQESRFAD